MKNLSNLFGCIALSCLMVGAHGMTLITQGDTLFASGEVTDDLLHFKNALDNPSVQQVVFVNSPGGDLWTGMQIGRLIASKGLNTVTAGTCVSACSTMFMGGRNRTFSDAFGPTATYVGIHGPHKKHTKEVAREKATQIYAFFKSQMGEQFNAAFINEALYDMDDAGSLTRVYDMLRPPKLYPYHCKSVQTPRNDCVTYKTETALSLGVITSTELTKVDLPAQFKITPRILGIELDTMVATDSERQKELGGKQCLSDRCKTTLTEFPTFKENKALAVPLGGTGIGFSADKDSVAVAFYSALYWCNHTKDKPARLCEVLFLNGFDVRDPLYAQTELNHRKALETLQIPPEKFYADEQYGGGFTASKGLRTEKFYDITPQTLDGIQTVGTQALARWLKSAQPPVVVDVRPGLDQAIPTSVALVSGGMAFADASVDAEFKARFEGLLKLLAPDRSKPIVFYCASRECWHAVNAAIRARAMGYTQVSWYRGGIASWIAAGLAAPNAVVRAIAY